MATSVSLPYTVESGAPVLVRVQFAGKKYLLRMGLNVMEVKPGPPAPPGGLPAFQVAAAPVMIVTEDES